MVRFGNVSLCVYRVNTGRVRGFLSSGVTHIKTHIYSHAIVALYGTLDKSISEMADGISEREGDGVCRCVYSAAWSFKVLFILGS